MTTKIKLIPHMENGKFYAGDRVRIVARSGYDARWRNLIGKVEGYTASSGFVQVALTGTSSTILVCEEFLEKV